MKNLGLVPLINFGHIMADIYRSAQPEYDYQFDWLYNHVGVRTIINLRAESILTNRKAVRRGMSVVHIPINNGHAPSMDQVDQFQSIISSTQEPLLIHCEHGHGRTSTFSVLTKLTFGQSLEQALQDEEQRFHYQLHHHAQVDFLKQYRQARLTA